MPCSPLAQVVAYGGETSRSENIADALNGGRVTALLQRFDRALHIFELDTVSGHDRHLPLMRSKG
ncbi:non-ribosomal peptide synthetase modules [Zymobacter palmae]|uniref:Non-ribosomal peptide synthetase modules n=1 Tax=Zymobacter palmae TaxID=33074 RepID=A0A348HEM7_9GAMM|nr:non-ribosomal peptide synthetase modules [Zymobacter palmae]